MLNERFYQLTQLAKAKQPKLRISSPYKSPATVSASEIPPANGLVTYLGYDYNNLVKCTGKAAGDFSQGSCLISLLPSALISEEPLTGLETSVINIGESVIESSDSSPRFVSPSSSSALKTSNNDQIYTMLEPADATVASTGIAFESWIKASLVRESVMVSYTSERLPLTEDSGPGHQTFILCIPASSNGKSQYDLIGNINGRKFMIQDPRLQQDEWVHVACSLNNVLALRFSTNNYVDLGKTPEWNVSDFTIAFTLELNELGKEQILVTKGNVNSPTPIRILVTSNNQLRHEFWTEDENGGNFKLRSATSTPEFWTEDENGGNSKARSATSTQQFQANTPYKIFISRAMTMVNIKDKAPRMAQCVTMRVWTADGAEVLTMDPPSLEELAGFSPRAGPDMAAQFCGNVRPNEESLTIGGTTNETQGLSGSIGPLRLYSIARSVPESYMPFTILDAGEKSVIGSYSFRPGVSTISLVSDNGMNNGKLKNEPIWIICPFKPDLQLSIFLDGTRANIGVPEETRANNFLLKNPAGPHQLTLGNTLFDQGSTRFCALGDHFVGEFDELRIWNVPRTRENICDTMHARLTEVPVELAVYLPFDDLESKSTPGTISGDSTFWLDATNNCWHMTPLYGFLPSKNISGAPIGYDAICVQHVLAESGAIASFPPAKLICSPSVAEYGDLQVSASGSLEGVYKRAYTFIDPQNLWCLHTGFRVGTLITQWVSQVQTSPTLIGYIEGAPPFPAENWKDERPPSTSVRFVQAESVEHSYGLQTETGEGSSFNAGALLGAEFEVSSGLGVETMITTGEVKGMISTGVDINKATILNNISMNQSITDVTVGMESTGQVIEGRYQPNNNGLALVESEVADIFALRLKLRGPVAPLVAYQMRPNPDIPKDRNLISFQINKSYTKQGCLDGMFDGKPDEPYPELKGPPKDVSYLKPIQAYALKTQIQRAEEQLEGEYERYKVNVSSGSPLPSRTQRNICNTYVWTADGGTFQENHSTMDYISSEVGNSRQRNEFIRDSMDIDITVAGVSAGGTVDALENNYTNVMQTKSKTSTQGFRLETNLPPPVDIREYNSETKMLEKRVGAVDSYRWMSIWLEPSVSGTDAFFEQVVDPQWLQQSTDNNARTLRELSASLAGEVGNARTKAWRLLHRVTYVSRILEDVSADPVAEAASALPQQKKQGALMADIGADWNLVQILEEKARGSKDKSQIAQSIQETVRKLYPAIKAQPIFYGQVIDFLAEYLGVE